MSLICGHCYCVTEEEWTWGVESSGFLYDDTPVTHELHRREARRNVTVSRDQMERTKLTDLPCDSLIRLSRYVLMKAFGRTTALDLLPLMSCDQLLPPSSIQINPLKLIQLRVKPWLLHQVLVFLKNGGMLPESQQVKAFSILKKKLLQSHDRASRKPVFRTKGWYNIIYLFPFPTHVNYFLLHLSIVMALLHFSALDWLFITFPSRNI